MRLVLAILVVSFLVISMLLTTGCDGADADGSADGSAAAAEDTAGGAGGGDVAPADTAGPAAPDAGNDVAAGADTSTGDCLPTGEEACDGVDNDCDGSTDEDLERPYYDGPEGTAGVGACRMGTEVCEEGTWVRRMGHTTPLDEVCDTADNDCDGATDEDVCDPAALTIEMAAPETECFEWEGIGGDVEVMLRWTTSGPAICKLAQQRNDGWVALFGFGEHTPITEHEFLDRLASYEFWDGPPEVGDRISWTAVCAPTEDALPALSAPAEIVLDAALTDCIWPFERACGDGGGIMCRVALPGCGEGRVPAVVEGCTRCVFPSTCTCDDGDPVECATDPPDCGTTLRPAVQGGCHVCVDPWTCAER